MAKPPPSEITKATISDQNQTQIEKKQEVNVNNLNQDHYQSILNTVMHLHLLDQYKLDYLKLPHVELPKPRKRSQRITLIIDIDETMIHTLDERDPPSMKG